MKFIYSIAIFLLLVGLQSCSSSRKASSGAPAETASADLSSNVRIKKKVAVYNIKTGNTPADSIVNFAKTLIGVPYKYGSAVKEKGFDCSGFITYVFTKFNIKVPRISWEFTNAGKEILPKNSQPGDLILFTGSDANSGIVGHMGIITQTNNGKIKFIHSASGGNRGVMISGMNSYFTPRFVKVIRVFSNFE